MKKSCISFLAILLTALCLTGCDFEPKLSLGGGTKTTVTKPTVGQQLVDLKKAEDCGAITPQEYQTQKDKILQGN